MPVKIQVATANIALLVQLDVMIRRLNLALEACAFGFERSIPALGSSCTDLDACGYKHWSKSKYEIIS